MNKRSKIFLFVLLALVLASGLILTGCEGPAGPAGSPGAKGTSDLNDGERAFIKANGFAFELRALGFTATPNTECTVVTATLAPANLPEGATIAIPAGVQFNWSSGAATVAAGKKLTISGGTGSSLKLTGALIALANGADGQPKTELNITAPAIDISVDAPFGSPPANTKVTVTSGAVTLSGPMAAETALTALGLTPANVDLVIGAAVTAAAAADVTFGSIKVNTSGSLTRNGAFTIAATNGITLNGGNLAGNAGAGTFNANVTVTGASSTLTTAVALAAGKKITVAKGGMFTVGIATTAPGGVVVEDGGEMLIANIALTTTAANDVAINSGGILAFTNATAPTLSPADSVQVKSGAMLRLDANTTPTDQTALDAITGLLQSGATLGVKNGITFTIPQSAVLDFTTTDIEVALLGTGANITLAKSSNTGTGQTDVGKIKFASTPVSIAADGSNQTVAQLAGAESSMTAAAAVSSDAVTVTDIVGGAVLGGTASPGPTHKGVLATSSSNNVVLSFNVAGNVISKDSKVIPLTT
jgi:hypothetical protein